MRIEEFNTDNYGGNAGILLDVHGASLDDDTTFDGGNHALFIRNGHIMGFKTFQRRLNASQTLSKYDSTIIDVSSSSDSTYTLPPTSDIEDGQRIEFITTNRWITIKANSGQTLQVGTNLSSLSQASVPNVDYLICVYDAINSRWWVRNMREQY